MKPVAIGLAVLALLAAGCGNSIDTAPAPTPTPGTPTPTPTPEGGLSGTYDVTTPAPQQICNTGTADVSLTFNAPNVDIVVDGSTFTPDWGFVEGVALSVPDPEHGTISGMDFTANYTYCDFNGAVTTKHVATWIGTFNGDGTFDSTLYQVLRNASGNQLATCGAGELDGTVTTDMGACTNPGVAWQIHGEKQ